ncbi:uncharacterized protein LOC111694922 [Eurytemora carolleeae]|uniref:uncharacterized protein LOC111694922 n=1 Tax=Eurytemora carolleeae TaxID=1294199 RepID=UPI000C763E01|nr:uncharacterized protein LOC111694922 [Eurytemora carolleeae]|eukprot:XP_023319751.1 uncharacterized protein LOC111694922 [Eurytemora affinis]
MRAKKLVGIVSGSDDDDHEKSIKEGLQIVQILQDGGRYDACLVEVSNQGPWRLHKGTDIAEIDQNKFQAVIQDFRVKPDVLLIQAKGKLGESGDLQEYFDTQGVPFSNSGVPQARLTFNKFECGNVLRTAGLPVVRSVLLGQNKEFNEEFKTKLSKAIRLPCIVKPNKSSSSCGITKVVASEELQEAITTALKYDDEVIFEPALVEGTEVSCTIHDITQDDMLEAFPVTEITHSGEFFHTNSSQPNAEISTPTKTLRGEVVAEVVKIAKLAYRTLKLTGLASFDMIIQDELPIILEVNSVPLLGPNSLVERQVKAGLSMQWQRNIPKFYNLLVEHAVRTFPLIRMKNQKKTEKK